MKQDTLNAEKKRAAMAATMGVGLATFAAALAGCGSREEPRTASAASTAPEADIIHPELWPRGESGVSRDPAIEMQITDILARMSLEQKVGQVIQADIGSVTPEDVRTYRIGSVLNGGSSGPYGDDHAPPEKWLALADEFWNASTDATGVDIAIPVIWGTDAVHGHSNIIGATVFPHNIGLGAARDPDLIERIGAATAKEIAATGIDTTFAPTLAVARNDRWGRAYESYSESPDVVASYGGAMVRGLQGAPDAEDFLGPERVIATAKHFLADGGTNDGKDQGDANISEDDLRDIHAAGYRTAIDAGAQTVMASFSSWRGQKMHGSRALLNDVLFDRLDFDGFIVGDWNARGKLPDCTNEDCPDALNAGLDLYMAPDSWKALYESTLSAAQEGAITEARLNEAVARILRVKLRAGIFEKGVPSSRPLAGRFELIGSREHRAIAREAVRKSLVLLKNNGEVLPLAPDANILVAGEAARDMNRQTGGWTISLQGTGNTRAEFPHGATIFEAVRDVVEAAGGNVVYSVDGVFTESPDAAIVVFDEKPYAEFKGDIKTLEFSPSDKSHLETMRRLQAAGVPVIAVFFSGRPMWVNAELNSADAFVAAWLPGTEGAGVTDALFRDTEGRVRYDFSGRLSFSWPKRPGQAELNVGDADYDPLFPFRYGLSYAAPAEVDCLPEIGIAAGADGTAIFDKGVAQPPWRITLRAEEGAIAASTFDRFAQEDAMRLEWKDAGAVAFEGGPADFSANVGDSAALILALRVEAPIESAVSLAMECGEACAGVVDVSEALAELPVGAWSEFGVTLSCFAAAGAELQRITAPLVLTASEPLALSLNRVRIASDETAICPGD